MKKKRKITGLAVLFLLLIQIFPITVFAAEEGAASSSQLTLTVSVTGYPADVDGGQAQTALPDGTEITVQGGEQIEGLLFVAEPLEGELYDWIVQCMEGKGTNIRAYDIYFLDKEGNRYEVTDPITLFFSLKGAYESPAAYYISESGETQKMEATVSGDQISFVTDHNSYYALAEQAEAEETEETEEPDETEGEDETGGAGETSGSGSGTSASGGTSGKDSPKTGDDTKTGLWMGAMTGSAVLAACCLVLYRKKKA